MPQKYYGSGMLDRNERVTLTLVFKTKMMVSALGMALNCIHRGVDKHSSTCQVDLAIETDFLCYEQLGS